MQRLVSINPPVDAGRGAVRCFFCEQWFEPHLRPDDPWRCPACNERTVFGKQHGRCPDCDAECSLVREGYDLKPLCHCTMTPEARAREAARVQREQARRQLNADLRRQEEDLRRNRDAAHQCWDQHDHHCTEPTGRKAPYDYCASCPRFKTPTATSRRTR